MFKEHETQEEYFRALARTLREHDVILTTNNAASHLKPGTFTVKNGILLYKTPDGGCLCLDGMEVVASLKTFERIAEDFGLTRVN